MRPYKYILTILLASSGVLIAANHIIGTAHGTAQTDKEKRNLGEAFYDRLQRVQTSVYPRLDINGAADGIPYGLRVKDVDDKTVSIAWNSPEPTDGYFDDFEDHDDFAVNSAGTIGWSYIDADNRNTYSWSATNFKNQGQKMAFIVMNPSATTPSVEANPNYVPTSGKKMLATMCSINAANNDWIISPELNFPEDFKFSFNARSYRTDGISPERMRVGYSTGGKSQSSFTFVTPEPYVELPAEWKLYQYTIPKEAKYVCINCVSDDAFMMLIDDIFIGTNDVRPGIMAQSKGNKIQGRHLTGFNVYRDGKKVNASLVTEVRYTDIADTYAQHTYTVAAVYSDGTESAQSEPVTVDVVDPALLPFEDDFDDWYLYPDRWTTPENPVGIENYWGIDYYTYGLVDPCATYPYNGLKDFDQSIVSRQLRTLDRATTYLRFETRLETWKIYPEETCYLAVEISNDNGKTWQKIDEFNNSKGMEPWTTHLYPLGDFIRSDYFRLRWRCHGPTAAHIDYWYVDDVKVWNASFGSLRLNVSSAEGAVKNSEVKLTGDNGSRYTVTTDASGNIAIGQIEAGNYQVDIVAAGYNAYRGTLTVASGQTQETNIRMQRPVLSLSATEVTTDLSAEQRATGSFTIQNTGDGPMVWRMNYAPARQSGTATDFTVRKSWRASGDLQTSIAFDGEYYYTTSWYYLGEFWKYDRQGNLIEQFRIPDMYYKLYDLAYDGRYFYGSDYSNRIFQLDFETKRIVNIIEITSAPELQITHIAYNPNNDRFYVGGWNTLCEVRRNGRTSSMAAAFDPDHGHAIYGSAYDNVTPGGPYLWLAAEETFNDNMLDEVVIYQYRLSDKKFTGVKKVCTDVPGYVYGSATRGRNYICGLEGTLDAATGRYTLVGALQQSPSLFFEYDVAKADTWLDYSPKKTTLQPGESTTVNVSFDARDAEVGKTYTATIPLLTIPELPEQKVTLGFKTSRESTTPRPVALTARQGNAADQVVLSWQQPKATPAAYNVYRNNQPIATNVTTTSYTDNGLVRGDYTYEVTAVYPAGESVKSDSVLHRVKVGAPYFAPLSLMAAVSGNRSVRLQWLSPLAFADAKATAMWGTGDHADQVGASSGGTFYAASYWDADDLVTYRNKRIVSASIRIVNPVNYLALCIFKDGERIVRKQVTDAVTYGAWTKVTLDQPVAIEPGSSYTVAFQIDHAEGMQPLATDASEAIDGKGNLLSVDGEYWFPATQMAIDGNFNIQFDIEPDAAHVETAPVGYNIYRDGTRINAAPVTALAYTDNVTTPGTYHYTVSSVYAATAYNPAPESAAGNEAEIDIISIADRLAPNALASHVECNRDITIGWGYPVAGNTTFPMSVLPDVTTAEAGYPSYVTSFLANGSEMAVASDGKRIYTSVYTENGRINEYDLSGNYIGYFYIKGLDGVRNITFDGTDFWVADGKTYIHRVDMSGHAVVESFSISEYARHIAYIPELDNGKGGFEVGDWNSSIYVTRRGAKIGDGPTYKGAAGTAYYDGKLYAFEQGNANAHIISVYDAKTNKRIAQIDLENYVGLNQVLSSVAGGMSVVHTREGLTFLAVNAQNTQSTSEVIFLDIASVTGVAGYNVYRDGKQVNTQLLTQRVFRETLDIEGVHAYQVETVYIDGTKSPLSIAENVTILPAGTADAPTDVQAVPSSLGYDVVVSFADPKLGTNVAVFQDFESQQPGTPLNIAGWSNDSGAWRATDLHYHGSVAIEAPRGVAGNLVLPVDGNGWLSFFARANGSEQASISVYTSSSTASAADFILLDEVTLTESWLQFQAPLPEGTRYVALRHADGEAVIVDALSLNAAAPVSTVWGYDVFRDGKKVNNSPVRGVSFIDHNLTPGVYRYQVRQQSVTAALSPLSSAVTLNLNYSNGGQAPEHLRVLDFSSAGAHLQWNAPALGDAVNLKWHTGNSYDAAGLPNGGAFYAGVRWAAADLADYAHLSLSQVEVYVNQVPDALFLLVYQGNNLVRRQYVQRLRQYSFNTIQLDEPLRIDPTKELRVVVYVEHNEITIPLGYDEGPARSGFGNLYSNDGISYTTMDNEDTAIYGNWNITIGLKPYAAMAKGKTSVVEDAATSSRRFPASFSMQPASIGSQQMPISQKAGARVSSDINTFEGYNIYANNRLVNERPVFTTTYADTNNYTIYPYVQYKVSAVYSQLGEAFSNVVVISTDDVNELETQRLNISTSGSTILISGATPGEKYSICNAAGQVMASGTVAATSQQFTMPSLAGVYIVEVGDQKVKISL